MVNPTELETLNAPQLRELTRELVERLSEQQYENAETIASLKRELLFKSTRIEQLSYELARYKRLRFARTSEQSLELLKMIIPKLSRVAVLWDTTSGPIPLAGIRSIAPTFGEAAGP